MNLPTKEGLCIFVEKSISNKQHNEEIIFPIPEATIERVKKNLPFNMLGYSCVISSHSIRHIKKRHPDDLVYLCEIVDILKNFDKVTKSLTRCKNTGANLISLEFYKTFDTDIVKLVKLKIHKNKRLELKTIFVKD